MPPASEEEMRVELEEVLSKHLRGKVRVDRVTVDFSVTQEHDQLRQALSNPNKVYFYWNPGGSIHLEFSVIE